MRTIRLTIGLVAIAAVLTGISPAAASDGTFVRAWGKDVLSNGAGNTGFEICEVAASCKLGSFGAPLRGGEFSTTANDVATDPSGNVYVVDTNSDRVQKFDSGGNFLLAFGKDVIDGGGTGYEVCTVAATCKTGELGSLGGELRNPSAVAADAFGHVFVVDDDNRRVQRFTTAGVWELAFGKNTIENGGLNTSYEICMTAASCRQGGSGSLGGELASAEGIATDAAGKVYVADTTNGRIQRYDNSGSWELAWGGDVIQGDPMNTFEVCTVAANCKGGGLGPGGTAEGGEMQSPGGVAVSGSVVYVADSSLSRVQKFTTAGAWQLAWGKDVIGGGTTDFEVCTTAANCKFGASGDLGGELMFPEGIAADAAGNVYVADTVNDRIQKYSSAGTWERTWGGDVIQGAPAGPEICTVATACQDGGSGNRLGGEMGGPEGVAVGAAGVYVTDTDDLRIQQFGSGGPPVQRTLTVSVTGSGQVTGNGINCPGDCNESYASGTVVTLTAAPSAGAVFSGWSGACSGTGTCNVAMTQNRSVSAAFATAPITTPTTTTPIPLAPTITPIPLKCKKGSVQKKGKCVKKPKKKRKK